MNKIQEYLDYLEEASATIGKISGSMTKLAKKPPHIKTFIIYTRRLKKIQALKDKIEKDAGRIKKTDDKEKKERAKKRLKKNKEKLKSEKRKLKR